MEHSSLDSLREDLTDRDPRALSRGRIQAWAMTLDKIPQPNPGMRVIQAHLKSLNAPQIAFRTRESIKNPYSKKSSRKDRVTVDKTVSILKRGQTPPTRKE